MGDFIAGGEDTPKTPWYRGFSDLVLLFSLFVKDFLERD